MLRRERQGGENSPPPTLTAFSSSRDDPAQHRHSDGVAFDAPRIFSMYATPGIGLS